MATATPFGHGDGQATPSCRFGGGEPPHGRMGVAEAKTTPKPIEGGFSHPKKLLGVAWPPLSGLGVTPHPQIGQMGWLGHPKEILRVVNTTTRF